MQRGVRRVRPRKLVAVELPYAALPLIANDIAAKLRRQP